MERRWTQKAAAGCLTQEPERRQLAWRSLRRNGMCPAVISALLALPASVSAQEPASTSASAPRATPDPTSTGRDFLGALGDSLKLVMMEHGLRLAFQEKTRAALEGPFWADYRRSVRMPRQWEDTDSWLVNYVGHPIHGAGAGIIWLDHSDRDRAASMFTTGYLSSRARAAAFSALYSVQFEIGPLSEASIGNVGMEPDTAGWVDYVVTPVGAMGLMIVEDVLDRYLVRWIESHVGNRFVRAIVRLVFGPSRFLANSAENRLPWYRPDRPLGGR